MHSISSVLEGDMHTYSSRVSSSVVVGVRVPILIRNEGMLEIHCVSDDLGFNSFDAFAVGVCFTNGVRKRNMMLTLSGTRTR